MLHRLAHSARVNVFESARFYFWVLISLTIHLVVRHSLIKYSALNLEPEWGVSKVFTVLIYGSTYACCIISAVFLKRNISKLFLYTWLIICSISAFNEFNFIIKNPEGYHLIESFSEGQGFRNIQITLPVLFLGVWESIDRSNSFTQIFLKIIYKITLLNSACVFIGVIFDISFFESYQMSGRWGYSGVLSRVYSVILSSIFLIEAFKKNVRFNYKKLLLTTALLCSGTKAGLLSFGLILFIVFIKSHLLRIIIAALFVTLLSAYTKWISLVVGFSPFWKNIYENYGAMGLLSSLRSENLIYLSEHFEKNLSALHVLIGGRFRSEELQVEILPVDLFLYYGIVGLIIFMLFFIKLIPSWRNSIPLLVACLSGSIITGPFSFLVWGLWCLKNGKRNY